MEKFLVRKLEQFTRLTDEERHVISELSSVRVRQVEAQADLISQGDRIHDVNIVLSGWAYRYKNMSDGRRQIFSIVLPGDLLDLNIYMLPHMDHSVGALTKIKIAEISRKQFERVLQDHPRITRALWWDTLLHMSLQREWVVSLGSRDAYERLGHLLCDVFIRVQNLGLGQGNSVEFPLTQAMLADACGLSVVHVNRMLQALRQKGLIVLKGRRLTIPDLDALMQASMFSPATIEQNDMLLGYGAEARV